VYHLLLPEQGIVCAAAGRRRLQNYRFHAASRATRKCPTAALPVINAHLANYVLPKPSQQIIVLYVKIHGHSFFSIRLYFYLCHPSSGLYLLERHHSLGSHWQFCCTLTL